MNMFRFLLSSAYHGMEAYSLRGVVWLSLIVTVCSQTLFSVDPSVVQLSYNNFTSVIHQSHSLSVVFFYATWCGHCQRTAPEYALLATDIHGWSPVVCTAAVACSIATNADLCRTYGVTGYPTFKMFPPNANVSYRGLKMDANDMTTALQMRNAIINYLDTLINTGQMDVSWPSFAYIRQVGELRGSTGSLYVIVENNDIALEHIAQMVILDLLDLRPAVVIGRMRLEHAQLNGITQPGLYGITNFGLLFLIESELSRVSIADRIRHRRRPPSGNNQLTTTTPGITTTLRYIPPDGVHMQDLESSLYYSLWIEVPTQSVFDGERLLALKKYIQMLARYLPVEDHIKKFLDETSVWLNTQPAPVTSQQWITQITSLQTGEAYVPHRLQWTGCNGSLPHYRGYPCSLWMTFHTLTVNAYITELTNRAFDAIQVLITIKDYVKHFLGCRECAANFARGAIHLETQNLSRSDLVLWLWSFHNRVNSRLHNDITEDPHYPKVQFPTQTECPECRSSRSSDWFAADDNVWRTDEVLTYLLRYYGEKHVIDDDIDYGDDGVSSERESLTECRVLFTEWSPCSHTCNVGTSARLSNNNTQCQMKLEIRLCLVRVCGAIFPDWSRQATNCARLGNTYQVSKPQRLTYADCTTVQRETWRMCGLCPPVRGRPICCRPLRSLTRTMDVSCRSTSSAVVGKVEVEVIEYCHCSECRPNEQ